MAETVEKLTTGEPLTIDQLLEYLPALKEIPRAQLENWAKGAAVRHRFRKGEIVCEEGAFGSTAYYIVSGTVDIFIHNPLAHLRTHPVRNFLGRSMRRMKSFLTDDQTDLRPEAHQRKFIGIDANVDLPINRPLAQLGPGELFGEMTCRTYQPRSATVQAREECVMVEMLRVILDMLVGNRQPSELTKATSKVKMPTFKGTSFKTELEKKYRERSLNNHLRAVPLFASLDDEFIEHLRQHVELVSYNQSQIICKEGDDADAFYLIRSGMVRVSNALPGGEMVRTYLSRGDYFGEIGLLGEGRRTATCTALDHVELVRIHGDEFHQMVDQFPEVRRSLEELARESGNVFRLNRRGYLFATADPARVPRFVETAREAATLGSGPVRLHATAASDYEPAAAEGFDSPLTGSDVLSFSSESRGAATRNASTSFSSRANVSFKSSAAALMIPPPIPSRRPRRRRPASGRAR